MGFIHLALLGGAALAVVPIVLHLVMRQQPKLLEFPALRFIQQRRESNRRRLKLRHLLLLLLRMAAIVLFAGSLARPFVRTSSGWLGDREAPVAAALIFDSAARMEYRQQNQTRLEVAQEIGGWLLEQLPADSQAAVLDARPGAPSFQLDLAAAAKRVDGMEPTAIARSVPEVIEAAAQLLAKSDLERKEVYVFTDLTRAALDPASMEPARRALEGLRSVSIYVIDVGVEKPRNFGLSPLELSGQQLARHAPLHITTELRAWGEGGERVVNAYVLDRSGDPQLRGSQSEKVSDDGATRVEFAVTGLETGIHQGLVELEGQDALAADDRRFFTVEVGPAWRILVVASPPAEENAFMLTEALAPVAFRESGQARFQCDVIATDAVEKTNLDPYAAVLLDDPRPLSGAAWQKLHSFAFAGGGIGIFLGPSAAESLVDFNSDAALGVLPGKLLRQARYPDGDLYPAPRAFEHPVLARNRALPWIDFPVFRYWQLELPSEGAATVMPYSNGAPALLERAIGAGRVAVLTTPVLDPQQFQPGDEWNLGPTPLPCFVLVNELTKYLAGGSDAQFNYGAGQDVVLHLPPDAKVDSCLLTTPGQQQFRLNANLADRTVTVAAPDQIGQYRASARGEDAKFDQGFSVNLAAADTDVTRADPAVLKELFGELPYRVARSRNQINRELSLGRVGRELFPILALLLAAVLAAEQVLANRFYRDRAVAARSASSPAG